MKEFVRGHAYHILLSEMCPSVFRIILMIPPPLYIEKMPPKTWVTYIFVPETALQSSKMQRHAVFVMCMAFWIGGTIARGKQNVTTNNDRVCSLSSSLSFWCNISNSVSKLYHYCRHVVCNLETTKKKKQIISIFLYVYIMRGFVISWKVMTLYYRYYFTT